MYLCLCFLGRLHLYAFFSLTLFLSLTIAYEVSLQNTNVLQSPWKQCEQRGGQGTVREGFFYHVGTVTKRAPHYTMCVFVHMNGTCSVACFQNP